MTNVCDKAKEARELLVTARSLEIAAGAIEDEHGARWQRGQSIVAAMKIVDEKLDRAEAASFPGVRRCLA